MSLFGPNEIVKTAKVFKNSGVPDYTFVDRKFIEANLTEAVELANKVVFFLGYSKSGKTVYRKKFFNKPNILYITFRCNKDSTVTDLYNYIAVQAKLSVNEHSSAAVTVKKHEGSSAKFENSMIGGVQGMSGQETTTNENYTTKTFDTRIDVNFLCTELAKKKPVIFLEDYHLVNSNFNQTFSEDLKHFLDDELLFIIIGIPGSPGRSFQYNPDLTGRSISLNFDFLTKSEAIELIEKGEKILNVQIPNDVKQKIIDCSYKNAYLIQSICNEIMAIQDINETSKSKVKLKDDISLVESACKNVAKRLESDYKAIVNVIIKGARTQKEGKAFNQYEEIIRVLKETDIENIEKGLTHTYIAKQTFDRFDPNDVESIIKTHNYKSVKSFKGSIQSQITQAFKSIELNFEKSHSRKILIVHDNTLYLMDIIFKFFLDWEENIFDESRFEDGITE